MYICFFIIKLMDNKNKHQYVVLIIIKHGFFAIPLTLVVVDIFCVCIPRDVHVSRPNGGQQQSIQAHNVRGPKNDGQTNERGMPNMVVEATQFGRFVAHGR